MLFKDITIIDENFSVIAISSYLKNYFIEKRLKNEGKRM